jgi:pyruvate-ferredoxin/flavodoxin oxidoreductase
MVEAVNPEGFKKMLAEAEKLAQERYALYEQLAKAMNPAAILAQQQASAPKAKA